MKSDTKLILKKLKRSPQYHDLFVYHRNDEALVFSSTLISNEDRLTTIDLAAVKSEPDYSSSSTKKKKKSSCNILITFINLCTFNWKTKENLILQPVIRLLKWFIGL